MREALESAVHEARVSQVNKPDDAPLSSCKWLECWLIATELAALFLRATWCALHTMAQLRTFTSNITGLSRLFVGNKSWTCAEGWALLHTPKCATVPSCIMKPCQPGIRVPFCNVMDCRDTF